MLTIVCIPAFNEERTIQKIIQLCSKHADKIIVCNDGSTDNTEHVANRAGAYVINHSKNMGKGASMQSLFKISKLLGADIVVTIDGDGQLNPDEIPKLIQPIKNSKSDIVIGNRFKSKNKIPKHRKFGNDILDKITKIASELHIEDTQSGFRAYSKNALEKIQFSTNGFGADAEILVSAVENKLVITEEPISVLYETGGKTSTKNPVSHTSEVFVSLIEEISIRRPLKLLGIPGTILFIIGIGFLINALSLFNETRYFSIPLTMLSVGTIMSGLSLLLMSFILFAITQTRKKQF